MGDSDDEFDRRGRGRDKFRGERNDFQRRDDRRSGGADDNKWGGGRESRPDFDRSRRFSPTRNEGSSPPSKRMRGEDGSAEAGLGAASKGGEADYPTQPPMMAFKAFLAQQDDNISDEEAIKKFNEYKLDFKKEQIHAFFTEHKDEEWFRAKYHPEECSKKKEAAAKALRARCHAFTKLLENGTVAKVSCDTDKNEDLVRLLDAAVILMEGGTDFDLQILDPNYTPETQKPKAPEEEKTPKKEVPMTVTFNKEDAAEKKEAEEDKDKKEEGEEGEEEPETKPEEKEEEKENTEEKPTEETAQNGDAAAAKKEEPMEPAAEEPEEGEEKMEEGAEQAEKPAEKPEEPKKAEEKKDVKAKKGKKRRRDSNDSFTSSSDSDGSLSSSDSDSEKSDAEKEKAAPKEDSSSEEEEEKDKTPRPQALHKTQSIFLRNLDPSITKQEVEAMCRQYPGFLRVGLQDPLPERRFFRRGWVTFDRTVNIKDICWNLNNIRLRDCDMGAIVNRELKQRVRPINGLTAHKPVVKADIKHAAKIVQSLDKKTGLWEEDQSEKKDKSEKEKRQYGLISRNPVLKNITDYLVDEGSYEEEAYLGAIGAADETVSPSEQTIERDEENIKVLDRLLLYLRIVHSFDLYTAIEYPNEDEMPHRCGIMHARAPAPRIVSESEVNEYNNVFETKVKAFHNMKSTLSEKESVRLGKKAEEVEVQKFLEANTQELAKDKWLCPLSGKKFKGPEFIHKHIVMKHNDKIDEVKVETEYFNNYLLDPKRPQLPEFPYPKSRSSSSSNNQASANAGGDSGYHGSGGGYQGGGNGYQGGGGGYFRPPYQGSNRGGGNWRGGGGGGGGGSWRGGGNSGYRRGGFNNSGGNYGGGGSSGGRRDTGRGGGGYVPPRRDRSRDPRGLIEYRDLDAPDESDIF